MRNRKGGQESERKRKIRREGERTKKRLFSSHVSNNIFSSSFNQKKRNLVDIHVGRTARRNERATKEKEKELKIEKRRKKKEKERKREKIEEKGIERRDEYFSIFSSCVTIHPETRMLSSSSEILSIRRNNRASTEKVSE